MRDLEEEKQIKEYMQAKMKHIKMYNECMNLADGLDVAKFAELVRADEREKCAKREWVGLTDEERHQISLDNRPYCANIMRAHEEELKRRNGG
jgi:hypothetical protein